jgi:hypothetical protein
MSLPRPGSAWLEGPASALARVFGFSGTGAWDMKGSLRAEDAGASFFPGPALFRPGWKGDPALDLPCDTSARSICTLAHTYL